MQTSITQDYIPSEEDLLTSSQGMDIYLLEDGAYVTQDYLDGIPCIWYVRRTGSGFTLGRTVGRVDVNSSTLISACMIAYILVFSDRGHNSIEGTKRVLLSVRARVPELTADELQLWFMKLVYSDVHTNDRVLNENELRTELIRRIDMEVASLQCTEENDQE